LDYIHKKDSVTNFQPTSELPTHLGIHQLIIKRGTNEKVVMHTHANELVALTQIKEFCNEEKLNKTLMGNASRNYGICSAKVLALFHTLHLALRILPSKTLKSA